MHQHPKETVADFAHCFCEIQHELDKHIPKIHCGLELIYAFLIKLREDVSRELFSREFNFKTLQELITAEQQYETCSTLGKSPSKQELSEWQPAEVNLIGPSRKKTDFSSQRTPHTKQRYGGNFKNNKYKTGQPRNQSTCHSSGIGRGKSQGGGDPASQICFHFNRNVRSTCELPNNGCQHKCLTCQQWGCKQLNHPPQVVTAAPKIRQAGRQSHVHVVAPPAPSSPSATGTDLSVVGEIKQMLTDIKSELHCDIQSLITRMDKLEALSQSASASKPQSTQDILSQAPAFGNPAITAVSSNLHISNLDLANKNILWTRITSADIPLPLPLDSLCSLSLVSQAHADAICNAHPAMQFTKLSTPLPV